jgi:hypothetical protein
MWHKVEPARDLKSAFLQRWAWARYNGNEALAKIIDKCNTELKIVAMKG